jgi:F-box and leucine-rich repeat protein GRR1
MYLSEFTDHQRSVFCVFSGQGVVNLRKHFNRLLAAEESRRNARPMNSETFPPLVPDNAGFGGGNPGPQGDGDVPEDGMVIDTHPSLHAVEAGDAPWVEQPLPLASDNPFSFAYAATHPPFAPVWLPWPEDPATATGEGSATPQEALPTGEAVADENGIAAQAGAGSSTNAAGPSLTSTDENADGQRDMSPIPLARIDISSTPDENGHFVTIHNPPTPPPEGSGSGGA